METVRVGLADVDGVLSQIDFLAAVNQAQTAFAFETVAVSVPDDAWDSVTTQHRYLRADRFAQRITTVTPTVNVLVCLTSHWLRDDETVNLLSWWSDSGPLKVAVISLAGVDAAYTRKALICELVASLASILGGAEVHTGGSRSCPLSFNPERTLPVRPKFDARCRTKLRRTIPRQLPALDAMLALFEQPKSADSDPGVITIPVVVHVVYKEKAQNISDAQIRSQIKVLNQDYRARNADISKVPEPFKPFIGDARIEFALAPVDPNGNTTTGITRTKTTHTSFQSDDTIKRVVEPWDPERFLNIWVCDLASGLLRVLPVSRWSAEDGRRRDQLQGVWHDGDGDGAVRQGTKRDRWHRDVPEPSPYLGRQK